MPCGLLVTATDGTIVRVNATFCGWVGLTAEELVGKKKLQELLTMGARIFHQTHWLPMLEMQGSIAEVKFDVKGKGGKTLPMILNVLRSATEAPSTTRYQRLLPRTATSTSASCLQRAIVQTTWSPRERPSSVRRTNDRHRQPRSAQSALRRHAVDEVLPKRGGDLADEPAQRLLSNIVRAGERAQRLIEDLLDFTVSRVGQGLQVTLEPANLHVIAEKAVEELLLAFPCR